MTNLNEIILRIKADTSNFDNPKDIIRDELPQFWRGNNLKFEIGVFDGDNLLSVSSYASITVAIRKMLDNGEIPSASHQALMQKSTYDLNDALTIETWKNGSSQHASVQFSAEESNILSGNHWLSIWASTSDAAPKYITLCAGIIRVCEDGGGISSQPPEPLVVYYTARECDDTFVNKDNVDPSIILGTSDEKISTQKAVKTYVDSIASEKASTASNLGSGEGVFSSKSGANLQFKSLKAGNNVTISSDSSEITRSSTGGGGGGMSNPMTTSGDLIVGGTSGIPTRLGVGSAGKYLKVGSSGNSIEWGDGSSYTLPPATSNILGGIKVGNNLSVTQDGTLSADAGQYELPVASSNTLGGIKIGERLSITSGGVLSANDQSYTLPPATSNTLGGIKVGNNLSVTQDGTLSADDQSYTLPVASASTLGGVKPDGSTITINSENGVISSTGEANTASNLGSGEGVFSSKSGANLQFKSLKAGSNVTISSDSSEITISSTGGGGGGMSNPMTTSGDLIVGGTSGTPTRLGVGSAGKYLKVGSSGNALEWGDGSSYTLPPATSNTLGGIKVGNNLSVTQDGTLSADAGQYELPVASTNTIGGIKVGERLSVTSGGILSANDQSYTLQPATSNTLGGIKVGNNLSVTQDGTLSADDQSYTLPIASASTLGGVKPDGSTITINSESGIISSTGEANTASNLGSGEGVFSSKSGVNLQFKSLKAGSNVTISSDSSEITIAAIGGGSGGMSNPMTTSGDLIVGGTSGTPTRLGIGSAGKFLKVGSSGNALEWGDGSSYTLPPATSNTLGGIKVGNNLSVTQDGTLSADAGQYELPIASANTLGGIKIGERLSVTSSGVLSANDQSYTLPPATSNTLGGIKVGNNLSVTQDGTLSADDQSYTLPIASASTLGGVKPDGSTITINSGNGIISSTGEANTASNLGSGEGIFSSKSGANLQFKSLKAGSNVTISSDSSEITISSAGGGGGGMSNPMTTSGDLIVGGTSGTPTRLGVGSAGKFLKVGSSGNSIEWGDGSSYTLPPATSNTLGGIKVGSNLSVTQDGTLSADAGQYELPVASTNTLGGIKVGERLSVTSGGVLSANDQSYTLQPATSNTLGGIKVGNNLSVTQDGTLSADAGQYELPIAGDSTLGGIKVGERLSITSSGVLSASDQSYTLPPATSSTLGGIKVGSNLSVTQDGTLSADDQSYTLPIASASTLGGVRPDGSTITINSESGVISSTGEANTASNLGSGEGVFLSKSGANLQFKSLKAGNNVTISADSSEITISSTGGGGGGGMSNPMTTSGDLIVGGTSGTPMRLGVGSAEQALVVNTNCDGVTWKDVLSCTSKSLSSNGYFTFSDGLILQWGYLAFAGTNRKESTITLPVSFSSKNYSFSGLIKSNVSGTDKHSLCLSENARSSSTLTVCIYGADSSTTLNGITWIAVGY